MEKLEQAYVQLSIASDYVDKAGPSLNLRGLSEHLRAAIQLFDIGLAELKEPTENKRQIVQIAGSDTRIYALCNDGSLWEMNSSGIWDRHPSIPQNEIDPAISNQLSETAL